MELSDLKPNPKNPRKITDKKLKALKQAMLEFGDLSGIILNRRTGHLVGGHMRIKIIESIGVLGVEGSEEGFIILQDGTKFSYRAVDWPEEKELAANIAANKGAGEWDNDGLRDMLLKLDAANFDLGLTMFDNHEIELALGLKEEKKKDKEKSGKQREIECPECACRFEI